MLIDEVLTKPSSLVVCDNCGIALALVRGITGEGNVTKVDITCLCGARSKVTYHRRGCACEAKARTDDGLVDCARLKQGCEDSGQREPQPTRASWVTSRPR